MPDHPHARWDVPPSHLLELIYETMSDGVAVFDTSGRVVYCNPALCLLVGRPVHDLIGKSAMEAWGAPGSELSRSAAMTTIEERIRRPDGLEKIVTSKSFGLTSSPPMQVQIYRDVTKIRDARRALEESYKVFHAFMANNPAVATIKDSEGRYLYVNPPAERLFGRTTDQCVGKSDADLWPPDVAQMMALHDEAVRRSGEAMQFEESIPTVSGERRFFTFKFPIDDSHGQNLLASTSLDVTGLMARKQEIDRREEIQEILLEIMAALSNSATRDLRRILVLMGAAIETTCATIAVRTGKGVLDVIQHHWWTSSDPGTQSQPRWCLDEAEIPWMMESLANGETIRIEDVGDLSGDPLELARLHAAETIAFLAAPIRDNDGGLMGFVAVDDCRENRDWRDAEARALVTVARMLAGHLRGPEA